MKAVVRTLYGHPEVLQVTALARPVPECNEVLVRVNGILVLGGGEAGDRIIGSIGRTLRARLRSMFVEQRLRMLVGIVKPEPLRALAGILGQAGMIPAIERVLPLEQVALAMRALAAGQVRGKLVLRVAA